MKTVIKLLLLLGVIVYLVFAFADFTRHGDTSRCRQIRFTIADSTHAGFITADEAERILRQSRAYPIGRPMDDINVRDIEATLLRNPYIDSVSCYKSPGGTINVLIEQRLPLMRIMADTGEQYYIDDKGHMMNPSGYVADLPVATGHITPMYARRHLVNLGRHLRESPFWDNQIEQANVLSDGRIELVPRVGNHLIMLGQADSLEQKFRNLYAFYRKVLPTVGWNKYSELSIEHVTQVVGKKAKH